jgi:DNA-binding transcriptional LysR family regulator
MLSADHLRTFVAVADTGSFTAAAVQLGFTQPAVSQHIRALETQLADTPLFRRVGQRMRLTVAGEELLNHAREIVALADRAERHILGLQGQVTGHIGLACAPSTGERLLPTLLAAFRNVHNAVQFTVEVGPSDSVLNWLTEREVECVLVDEHPRRRSLDVLPIGYEAVVCLAARGHALLTSDEPRVADLRAMPLIVPPRGTTMRRAVEDALRRRIGGSINLEIALQTESATLAGQAAADGLGVAFMPQHRVPRTRDVAVVPIDGWELEQHWFLVRRRSGETDSALDQFWNFVSGTDGRRVLSRLGLQAPRPQATRGGDTVDDPK